MKKYFLFLLVLLVFQTVSAQNNLLWKGYFSYNEIKDLAQAPNTVFAASENALFSKNLQTTALKTTNTVDGLSGQTITALYHSTTANKTLVGYDNGLLIVINETDHSMLNVVDIINKQLPPNIKKINHFMEYNGLVYISCDYGISVYNLATLGFGDTYYIGTGVAEIKVNQTAVFNGLIYAATQDYGMKRADVTNPNLIDATQWTTVTAGNWAAVETFNTVLTAVTVSGQLYRLNGATFTTFGQLSGAPLDFRAAGTYLIATSGNRVTVYNQTLNIVTQFNNSQIPEMVDTFTCATVINEKLYVGTREHGVLEVDINNPLAIEFISPDGPIRNDMFAIHGATENLWAVYGRYTFLYNPFPLDSYGISKYNATDGWKNIPYAEVHAPGKQANDLSRITINPANPNQVYISSYHSGLLKFEEDVLVTQYDESNSGLESLVDPAFPGAISVRIEQSAYDRSGNLWMTNGLLEDPLKVLTAGGSWQSYNMSSVLNNTFNARFQKLVVDKNNTKWMATYSDGLIGFNENGNIFKKITVGSDAGNLPVKDVRALAIDNRNQLWIGCRGGLRVMSVDRFNDAQPTTNAIIILEDDVAQELLYEQVITDIAVDGANNKWIGTADSGVFHVSSNGQETLHRFTINNSPLPSNSINDIDINGTTGEVFIATDKGLVSFKGVSTKGNDNLNNVIVYPNPVRPEFGGTVKITGLLDKANVKITDIEGNLVYEVISNGGTIEWDTTAFGKYRVASGVYMIFISAEDGGETKVKKVMIIR